MKLFLASHARHPDSVEKLKNFVVKPLSQLKIVYIPTAANGSGYGSWKGSESLKMIKSWGSPPQILEKQFMLVAALGA